tara:strand:- start:923 stop:1780 length:858 start_codon:yes stop_codon:yes gene_type:complete
MEKNISEEIKRIKTLFTEERLYGNLVEATNPDTNNDNVIDATEFTASGNEIDRVEAELFLTSNSKPKENLVDYCLRSGSTLTLPKEVIESKVPVSSKFVTKINSSGTNCFWEMRNPSSAIITAPQVSMVYILEGYKMGFFVRLSPVINLSTLADAAKTLEYRDPLLTSLITTNAVRNKEEKIEYLKFVGKLNPSQFSSTPSYSDIEYVDLKFTGFYDTKFRQAENRLEQPLFKSLEHLPNGGYRPLDGGGTRIDNYAPKVDGIIEELGISPGSGKIESIIDNLQS